MLTLRGALSNQSSRVLRFDHLDVSSGDPASRLARCHDRALNLRLGLDVVKDSDKVGEDFLVQRVDLGPRCVHPDDGYAVVSDCVGGMLQPLRRCHRQTTSDGACTRKHFNLLAILCTFVRIRSLDMAHLSTNQSIHGLDGLLSFYLVSAKLYTMQYCIRQR